MRIVCSGFNFQFCRLAGLHPYGYTLIWFFLFQKFTPSRCTLQLFSIGKYHVVFNLCAIFILVQLVLPTHLLVYLDLRFARFALLAPLPPRMPLNVPVIQVFTTYVTWHTRSFLNVPNRIDTLMNLYTDTQFYITQAICTMTPRACARLVPWAPFILSGLPPAMPPADSALLGQFPILPALWVAHVCIHHVYEPVKITAF